MDFLTVGNANDIGFAGRLARLRVCRVGGQAVAQKLAESCK